MTLLSLFDGSGGFPLAASVCGISPVACSEVEPYPIAVTRSRFPNMIHLGDVSKVDGGKVTPCSVITFGSPCQDLSIAGRRAGLKHEEMGDEETTRSGLFMEAIRIAKEMRKATNNQYPSFLVWENVPGAFSSNKGEDFRVVLEELIKIVEPTAVMPSVPKGGWAYADMYSGDGWSLAYRIFDAQHWGKAIRERSSGIMRYLGTPQRRRRIYLVFDLRGNRAGKILFEHDCMFWNSEKSSAAWENFTGNAQACSGETGKDCVCVTKDQYLFENHSQDTRYKGPLDTCPLLPAQLGTGGNNTPFVVEKTRQCFAMQGFGDYIESETASALKARDYKDATDLVVDYAIRRLTPTECARLQGFPPQWGDIDHKDDFTEEEYHFWLNVRNTHAEINGKPVKEYTKKQMLTWYGKLHTDSAEYKLWGNGLALPCALYIMQGIAIELSKE